MPLDVLEIETRDGLQRFPLDKPRLTIGRLPGNDIVLPFAQISRHHAEVRQRGADWWIIDLGSTNGLRVGANKVKEYLLHGGDRVLLAPTIALYFVSQRPPEDLTVEGTVQLPAVATPARPTPTRTPTTPEPDPFTISASEIAAAASMPLPRRKLGLTAPPQQAAARPPAPEPTDAELDAWLNEYPPAGPPPQKPRAGLPLPTPFALLRRKGPAAPAPAKQKPLLYLCPTCGERTAPDSPYCWSCRQTIAQPCRQCGLFLLPIQAVCPRCEAPNAHSVRR
jgi:hypothetical protein